MKKSRVASFLSPKKLLRQQEYEKYKETKEVIARRNLRERIKEMNKEREYRRGIAKYEGTRTGKLGKGIASGIQMLGRRGGVSRALYRSEGQLPPAGMRMNRNTIQGIKSGRGRPKGTLDRRYAEYGGVYGFRKFQANQFKIQRMEAMRRTVITPNEQQILNKINERRRQMGISRESRVIPDTLGYVDLDGVMKEINNASNLVD